MANRNQRALCIDLKSTEGRELIYTLVRDKGYDVIIENFRPGVMDKLCLGYEDMKNCNQKVIYCSCSGYGSSGPKVAKPGQDILIQGMSGMAALGGTPDHPPMPAGTALVDQHGAILAALGIVAAVYDRSKTGKGHRIEASLLASSFDLQIEPLNYFLAGAKLPERLDTGIATRFHQSPYGVYKTKDTCVTLSLNPFEKLKQVFSPGALDRFTPNDQLENRPEFDKTVRDELLKKTSAEWSEIFEAEGLWYAPVNEYADVIKDEQVIYNNPFITMNHPIAGEVKVLGHANRYDGKTLPLRRLPPALGEHTAEILREAGYCDEDIERLEKEGKIFITQK
jgi:crotonobetainyl-CoA:carnitine CoA-transferase CaiB-like acyl-CoA transferase